MVLPISKIYCCSDYFSDWYCKLLTLFSGSVAMIYWCYRKLSMSVFLPMSVSPPMCPCPCLYPCPLGCSDFHFFHIFGNVSPSLLSLGPKSSENVEKNNFSSAVLSEFFWTFSKIYVFSELFKTNFRSQY